jgi:hypothetical protein
MFVSPNQICWAWAQSLAGPQNKKTKTKPQKRKKKKFITPKNKNASVSVCTRLGHAVVAAVIHPSRTQSTPPRLPSLLLKESACATSFLPRPRPLLLEIPSVVAGKEVALLLSFSLWLIALVGGRVRFWFFTAAGTRIGNLSFLRPDSSPINPACCRFACCVARGVIIPVYDLISSFFLIFVGWVGTPKFVPLVEDTRIVEGWMH